MNQADWIWMPHAGHFIGGSSCRFHLNTYVGDYIVSTVGEYDPKGRGWGKFEQLGYDRLYETMVFRAIKETEPTAMCCPYTILVSEEMEMDGYNDPVEAYNGHLALCKKWSTAPTPPIKGKD